MEKEEKVKKDNAADDSSTPGAEHTHTWVDELKERIDTEFPLSGGETEEDMASGGEEDENVAGREHLDENFPLSGGVSE